MAVEIYLDKERCIGCQTCIKGCPVGIYQLVEGKCCVVKENVGACFQDLSCQSYCPTEAISVKILSEYQRGEREGLPKNIVELKPGMFQIRAYKPGSHIYLIKGAHKNVLIDSGLEEYYPHLEFSLKQLGVEPGNIDLVIDTHEHFDHIGANRFFADSSIIAAHRLSATKIKLQDEYVIQAYVHGHDIEKLKIDLWLENLNVIDLDNYKLKIFHTPGHTSGCICIYEPFHKFIFTGDTVFAGGIISYIAPSGSWGDYVNSIERLCSMKIEEIYPAHGWISKSGEEDLFRAGEEAKSRMDQYLESLRNKNK